MENNNLVARIEELRNDNQIYIILDDYFGGYNDIFDIYAEYLYTDYPTQVRFSEDRTSAISAIAMTIAEKYVGILRADENLASLSDDELMVLSAWKIAKMIEREENKHAATWQAEEYADDSSKVEQYGTKTRAYNKGYDHYMEGHVSSGDVYLDCIVDSYVQSKEEEKTI